jgi:transposase-like protein
MDATVKGFATPRGLTLIQIMERFSTPDQAREYLEALHWPNGPVCPHCGEAKRIYSVTPNPAKKIRAGLKKCGNPEKDSVGSRICGKQFTVTVGTVFEDSHVPLHKWLIAVYLMCSSKKSMSAHQLHRMLGTTYKTAWFMFHRLRFAVRQPSFQTKLGGAGKVVEADETWVGGRKRYVGQGRGYVNKTIVFGLVERGGDVRMMPMGSVTSSGLGKALREHADVQSRLMTDGHINYTDVGKEFVSHERVDHSKNEYARGDVTTNTIESCFALFKRGVHGTYHQIGKKYIPQYLGEFTFRYNHRKIEDGPRTEIAIGRTRGKRLMLREPMASIPVSR